MKTRMQKWGNSMAMRIPKHIVEELGLEEGTEVEISVEDRRIIVSPVQPLTYDLSLLLKKVNSRNIHAEVDWSAPVGKELI